MSVNLSIPEIVRKKRDNKELAEEEIQFLVDRIITDVPEDKIHDSQIGAFLMATYLNGMSPEENAALVKSMTYSGFNFKWPEAWKGTVVDKHSTGGVGDKVSLVLAPALAACGLRVPMISGRGLDFTGGTLDKLESIPGFSVFLSKERMMEVLETVGCCIVGQTADIVPADKVLYSIRDITATVDNESLIVASIISKKAAEGLDSLVLDVKTGRGAMMKEFEKSESLATKLVQTGKMFGMNVSAFITNMDCPVGRAVGNALEVADAIDCLNSKGAQDLLALTVALGGKLLYSVGKSKSLEEGELRIAEVIANGSAIRKFRDMAVSQGTDQAVADELCFGDKWKYLPHSENVVTILSKKSGFVTDIDAMAVAKLCHKLGCGRTTPGSSIKYEPGVMLVKKPGEAVQKGEVLMEIHLANDAPSPPEFSAESIITIADKLPSNPSPLVIKMVD